jgi:hypothetical protein
MDKVAFTTWSIHLIYVSVTLRAKLWLRVPSDFNQCEVGALRLLGAIKPEPFVGLMEKSTPTVFVTYPSVTQGKHSHIHQPAIRQYS